MRFSEQRLVDMALGALEEVAATCHHRPARRSAALRLVLAYLASRGRSDRRPYRSFWQSVAHPRPQDRWAGANAALNAIYLAVGRKRDIDVVSLYEERARATLGGVE